MDENRPGGNDDGTGCMIVVFLLVVAIVGSLVFRGIMHLLGIEEPPDGFQWEP